MADQTIRQFVNTSVGGSGVRLRLTNRYGAEPVTFDRVTVAIRDSGAGVVSGTSEVVTFGGEESVYVPAGAVVYSDPVPLDVEADQDLAISIYPADPTGPATRHPLGLKQTYLSDGDQTDDPDGDAYSELNRSWYFVKGVDVVARENVSMIVALGDSITDGFESTPLEDHRYPDYLARRIADDESVKRSVVNAGISGNRVLHDSVSGTGFGESALARLAHDVIAQPAATDVILMEGINDIGQSPPEASADQIIFGLKQIDRQLHANGINVFAGTLTPAKGTPYGEDYYADGGEEQSQTVNEFIRETDVFDGVVDFDRALRDPDNPERFLPKYDSGDHLHPNDAGYEEMAETVDLSFFRGKRKSQHPPSN